MWVGFLVYCFVKIVIEVFVGFGDFFIDFVFDFFYVFFDEYISLEMVFVIFIVDQWIVEGIYMAGSFLGFGVYENGRIQIDDVVVYLYYVFLLIIFEVIFEFNIIGIVIIYGVQAIVYFVGLVNKVIFFVVGYQFFEQIVLLCYSFLINYIRLYVVVLFVFEFVKVVKILFIWN